MSENNPHIDDNNDIEDIHNIKEETDLEKTEDSFEALEDAHKALINLIKSSPQNGRASMQSVEDACDDFYASLVVTAVADQSNLNAVNEGTEALKQSITNNDQDAFMLAIQRIDGAFKTVQARLIQQTEEALLPRDGQTIEQRCQAILNQYQIHERSNERQNLVQQIPEIESVAQNLAKTREERLAITREQRNARLNRADTNTRRNINARLVRSRRQERNFAEQLVKLLKKFNTDTEAISKKIQQEGYITIGGQRVMSHQKVEEIFKPLLREDLTLKPTEQFRDIRDLVSDNQSNILNKIQAIRDNDGLTQFREIITTINETINTIDAAEQDLFADTLRANFLRNINNAVIKQLTRIAQQARDAANNDQADIISRQADLATTIEHLNTIANALRNTAWIDQIHFGTVSSEIVNLAILNKKLEKEVKIFTHKNTDSTQNQDNTEQTTFTKDFQSQEVSIALDETDEIAIKKLEDAQKEYLYKNLNQQGGYIVKDKINEGGMATIYAVHLDPDVSNRKYTKDTVTVLTPGLVTEGIKEVTVPINMPLCVKVTKASILKESEMTLNKFNQKQLQLVKEAKVMATVSNAPHAVKVLDIHTELTCLTDEGLDGDIAYSTAVIMEKLEGESLKTILVNNKPIEFEYRLKYIQDICENLNYVHKGTFGDDNKHIAHLDIKPENILIDNNGVARIIDWGASNLMQLKRQPGTPKYCPPEAFKGVYATTNDIYACGMTFYHMLTGKAAYQIPPKFKKADEIHDFVATIEITPPHEINPEIPKDLSDMIMRMLAKSAEDRPNMQEILNFIKSFRETAQTLEFIKHFPYEEKKIYSDGQTQILGGEADNYEDSVNDLEATDEDTPNNEPLKAAEAFTQQDFIDYTQISNNIKTRFESLQNLTNIKENLSESQRNTGSSNFIELKNLINQIVQSSQKYAQFQAISKEAPIEQIQSQWNAIQEKWLQKSQQQPKHSQKSAEKASERLLTEEEIQDFIQTYKKVLDYNDINQFTAREAMRAIFGYDNKYFDITQSEPTIVSKFRKDSLKYSPDKYYTVPAKQLETFTQTLKEELHQETNVSLNDATTEISKKLNECYDHVKIIDQAKKLNETTAIEALLEGNIGLYKNFNVEIRSMIINAYSEAVKQYLTKLSSHLRFPYRENVMTFSVHCNQETTDQIAKLFSGKGYTTEILRYTRSVVNDSDLQVILDHIIKLDEGDPFNDETGEMIIEMPPHEILEDFVNSIIISNLSELPEEYLTQFHNKDTQNYFFESFPEIQKACEMSGDNVNVTLKKIKKENDMVANIKNFFEKTQGKRALREDEKLS